MGKMIIVSNMKGGCGKTMTTLSLGVGLARKGKRVLCLDADPQHSLTVSCGIAEPEKLTVTLSSVLTNIINGTDFEATNGIINHSEGFDLMPSNNALAGMEFSLIQLIGRETILRQYINRIKHTYDYIVADCAPSLDLLTVNALAAAHSVVIPVVPRFLDAKGLELLLKSIAQIREYINPTLSIEGILFTMTDQRMKFTKEIIAMIESAYGNKIHIFGNHIPHSVRAAEASATGKSIFTHDPTGRVASAYYSLAEEVLGNA